MRDEIIKRNLIVNSISLLIFFLLSLISFSYFNKKNIENELVNISSLIETNLKKTSTKEELIAEADSYSTKNNFIIIVLSDSNGSIFYDSSDDSVGIVTIDNIKEDELKKTNSDNNVYSTDEALFYISKINDNYFMRIEIQYESNSNYILLSIFFAVFILLFVIFITFFVSKKTSKNVIDKFEDIREHLKTINEGEYDRIPTTSNYPEIEPILDEINEINTNLYLSLSKITNERDKQSFIINNMEQGLIIINEDGQVELINNYALTSLEIDKEINEKDNYEDALNNEYIISAIRKSLVKKNNAYFDIFDKTSNKVYSVSLSYLKNKWDSLSHQVGLIVILIDDVTFIRANDKIKREFVSNASHELKSPITSISGFSELLLSNKDSFDEKTIKYLNIIYTESIKMKKSINNLLYLSKLESGEKIESIKTDVYFKDVVTDVLDSFNQDIEAMNIKIINDIDDSKLYVENELLIHLIRNLIENAIKYNKVNGSIKISTITKNNQVILRISDSGIGISEQYIDRIYERFFRVDESHNRVKNSTGLGLNIVKKIVDILDAKISVDSKIDIGTTFTVEFNK